MNNKKLISYYISPSEFPMELVCKILSYIISDDYKIINGKIIGKIKNTEVYKNFFNIYKNDLISADTTFFRSDIMKTCPRILKYLPIINNGKKEYGYSIEGSVYGYAICKYNILDGKVKKYYDPDFIEEILYTNIEDKLIPIRHRFNEKWYIQNKMEKPYLMFSRQRLEELFII